MTYDVDAQTKFQKFHSLVKSGVDYGDAIKQVEGTEDYVLSDTDRELFDALFCVDSFLDSLSDVPKAALPQKELDLLSEKLSEILQKTQSEIDLTKQPTFSK